MKNILLSVVKIDHLLSYNIMFYIVAKHTF